MLFHEENICFFHTVLVHPRQKIVAAVFAVALVAALFAELVREMNNSRYQHLDLPIVLSNEEEVVNTIRDGLTARMDQITITFHANGEYSSQMTALADGLFEKALEPTGDPKQGDYLRFQYGGYQVRYSNPPSPAGGYDYTVKLIPDYYTNAARERAVDRAVSSFLEEAAFTPVTSDYEKIRTAHDYLVRHCAYDWRNSSLAHRHIKSTACGALVDGEASCQGYSVAMYRLLMESGVRCRVITGYATSPLTGRTEYHAWNLVRLDGSWYNVDVLWDDATDSDAYFLKSDALFSTHVRDEKYDTDVFRAACPVSSMDWNASR